MLHVAAVNAMGGPPRFKDLPYHGEAPPAFEKATKLDLSPLKVDVSGLFSPYDCPSQTRSLRASAIDRTYRLQHFQHILLDSIFRADFLANAFYHSTQVVNTAAPTSWGHKGTYDPKTRTWYAPRRPKAPNVDARDLIHEWKDFERATNVQLESLCIYGLGSSERLPGGGVRLKQPTEVDSITLPEIR